MRPVPSLALLVLTCVLLLGALVACGGEEERTSRSRSDRESSDSGGTSPSAAELPESPAGLIPIDSSLAIIFDIQEMLDNSVPESIRGGFEDWAGWLLDGDIDLADIDTLVVIDDTLLVAQGNFNFASIRRGLEELGYESDFYRDIEVWGERAALVEDSDYVIISFAPEAIQDLISDIDRGRNLLAFEQDSDLAQVVDEVGSGAIVLLPSDCSDAPVSGCTATGLSYSFRASQTGLMRVRTFFLFEDEDYAADALAEAEDSPLDGSGVAEVLDVRGENNAMFLEFDIEIDDLGDFYLLVEDGPVARRLAPAADSPAAVANPAPAATRSRGGGIFPTEAPAAPVATSAPAAIPDGEFRNARPIYGGDIEAGRIRQGNEDYFVFDASRGSVYILETTADFDTVIELYDDSGRRISYDDDGGVDGASRLLWTAEYSGEHFLKVRGYDSGSAGNYRLSLAHVDTDEHGNAARNATRLGSDDVTDGTILEGDLDYFVFDARRGRTYILETVAEFDTVIQLYDDRDREIAYDDDGGRGDGSSRLTWVAEYSGEHFVVVRGYSDGSIGSYSLFISESR